MTDQRGVSRPKGGFEYDLGSVEDDSAERIAAQRAILIRKIRAATKKLKAAKKKKSVRKAKKFSKLVKNYQRQLRRL